MTLAVKPVHPVSLSAADAFVGEDDRPLDKPFLALFPF